MTLFSKRLKELRKEKNLTQKSLGEKTGLSERGIQNYELELRKPSAESVVILADFFDVSTDYLLGRSDDPARH